jgi:hypothetical protein
MRSLLLGESALPAVQKQIEAGLERSPACGARLTVPQLVEAINASERRVRAVEVPAGRGSMSSPTWALPRP